MLGPVCHTAVRGYGSPGAVCFVGIAPGRDEEQAGKPFVGNAGKLLDAVLESVDINREDVYATNLICWWKNAPDINDINKCKDRLLAELNEVKPRLVVPLGTIPSQVFVGDKISKTRGIAKWNARLNAYVMPTYHPAAILHSQGENDWYIHDLVRDISKIPLILEWPDGGPKPIERTIINDVDVARAVLDCITPSTLVSLDIETNYGQEDIDVFSENLLCYAITFEYKSNEHTFVFPYSVATRVNLPPARWLFQNGMFDTQGLRRYLDIDIPIAEDTLLQSYALDEREDAVHKLKVLAREFCGADYYELDVRKQKKANALTDDTLYDYNAKDAAYTYRLFNIFDKRIKDDGVANLYNNILLPAANTFARMNYRGMHVDREAVRQLGLEWFPMYIKAEEDLQIMVKETGFDDVLNPSSPLQLGKFIYGQLGMPVLKRTKLGAPSTDNDALESLAGHHEFIDKLLEYRQLSHMVNTYLIGVVDDIKFDMRLHPNTLLHGSVTGRTSYRKPPLQTIPRDYKPGHLPLNRVRRMFAATNDDYVLLEADYKQIELWVAYFFSGDQRMYENLMTGDFHGATARDPKVYGAESCTVHTSTQFDCMDCVAWDGYRTNAKRVGFGIMYGRTEYGLSKGQSRIADNPIDARPYLKGWRDLYSTYQEWYTETQRRAIEDGYLESPSGRKRRFRLVLPETEARVIRQAVNFPIQATANDYNLTSLIELFPLLEPLDCHPLITVHDSILFEIRRKYFDEAVGIIREVMERPRFGFPGVKVDMKVGPNWLETVKI